MRQDKTRVSKVSDRVTVNRRFRVGKSRIPYLTLVYLASRDTKRRFKVKYLTLLYSNTLGFARHRQKDIRYSYLPHKVPNLIQYHQLVQKDP